MSKGIELSEKYGVNATMPVCFWCGETKNEIALLGRIREKDPITGKSIRGTDLEAPMKMVLDYEPCDKCKEKWDKGFTVIEVSPNPLQKGMPPICSDMVDGELYPTGRYLVLLNGVEKNIFNEKYTAKERLYCDTGVFNQLIPEEE